MKIGYVRVSTRDQNTARQEQLMEALGVEMVYIDRMSGKDTNRPELKKMMEYLRPGDTVVVESISRFARTTSDLLQLMDALQQKGAAFVSQKESIDTESPSGKFMLTVFGALAELERDYLRQRQREGIDIAMANGTYRGRPAKKLKGWEQIVALNKAGEITAVEAARRLGISVSSYYRKLKG